MTRKHRKDDSDSWHLHKRFSLGIILAIILNCGSFVWYASQMNSRVEDDHLSILDLNKWREQQNGDKSAIAAHLAVIDQRLSDQKDSLADQTKTLQRIDDRMQNQSHR